jgi:hypothetical protein
MKKSFYKTVLQHSQDNFYTWKDIKDLLEEIEISLEDDDIIDISFQEGFYTENNSCDDCYVFTLTRNCLETDEEYHLRLKDEERLKEESRKLRYNKYLELKKEFEQ